VDIDPWVPTAGSVGEPSATRRLPARVSRSARTSAECPGEPEAWVLRLVWHHPAPGAAGRRSRPWSGAGLPWAGVQPQPVAAGVVQPQLSRRDSEPGPSGEHLAHHPVRWRELVRAVDRDRLGDVAEPQDAAVDPYPALDLPAAGDRPEPGAFDRQPGRAGRARGHGQGGAVD